MLSDDLLALQHIDTSLEQLAHRLASLPERQAAIAAQADMERNRKRLAALEVRQQEVGAAVDAAERDGADITKHTERLQGQLKTVIAPREAEALMHELDTLAAQRDALDDTELELLEEQSQLLDDVESVRAAAPALTAVLAAAEAALDLVAGEASREEGALREQRGGLVAGIEPAVLADYERRREHFRGVAIAKLDGRRCGGCRMDLSTGEYERLVASTAPGAVGDCPQCGRMLVP